MNLRTILFGGVSALFGLCLSLSILATTQAQLPSEEAEARPSEIEKSNDPYQLPTGGVKELLSFIEVLQTMRATEPRDEYEAKAFPAMKLAAQKIRELATDEDKKLAGFDRATDIWLYFEESDPGGDSAPDGQKRPTDENRRRVMRAIAAHLATNKNPSLFVKVAVTHLPLNLEHDGRHELATEIYRDLGGALLKSPNPEIVRIGTQMQGAARRLRLVGRSIRITGTATDGKKFDSATYRGKVLLIDFWATWCGACREEFSNIRQNYLTYHDRGFEVVGISVDDDRKKLDKLLADDPPPWTTLYDGTWDENPVARDYGVFSIPTIILIDKQGKVVSTDAGGPALRKQLERLIGPATAPPASPGAVVK